LRPVFVFNHGDTEATKFFKIFSVLSVSPR
jgi:hypothetical protein